MAFQAFQVVGVKGFKGTVDGQTHDSTKFRVLLRTSDRAGTEIGFNVLEIPAGKEEVYQKVKAMQAANQIKFPCAMELDTEQTTRGLECFDWRLAQPAKG